MVRSFVRPIVRSFVRSFVQIILFLPLCCQNSDRPFVRSFDRSSFVHSSYSSFTVTILPLLFTVTILPSLFTVTILPLLFTVTFYRYYLPLLFTVTIYRYYLPSLFTVTIYHHYFTVTIYRHYFTITIYRYYSPLLFIDHPLTPNFNYSSIMLSSSPKTSQTHIPVIQTPVTVIFLPVGTSHLVTHPRFLQVEHA
jgi:hypothetical protein